MKANAFVVFTFVQILPGRDFSPHHHLRKQIHPPGPLCESAVWEVIEFERLDMKRGRILQAQIMQGIFNPPKYFQSL